MGMVANLGNEGDRNDVSEQRDRERTLVGVGREHPEIRKLILHTIRLLATQAEYGVD